MADLKHQVEETLRVKSKIIHWGTIEECSAIGLAIEIGQSRQKISKIL